jgi:PleD family two-component response regulator
MKQLLSLEKIRFLVVDDLQFMRRIFRDVLRSLNARQIHTSLEGGDAFKAMRTNTPDIIIIDWDMEPVDGIELTRMIRDPDHPASAFVPIIMATGNTEPRRIAEAWDAGVTEVIGEPFTAKALYSRIDEAIQRPRPFGRSETFFGPDRRRHKHAVYDGPLRRRDDPKAIRPASPRNGNGSTLPTGGRTKHSTIPSPISTVLHW